MTDIRQPTPCLDAETMAAFIDGRLNAAARAQAEDHMAGCEDCYEALAEVVHLQTMAGREAVAAGVRPPKRLWVLAAGVAASIVAAALSWDTLFRTGPARPRPELAALVEAAGATRSIEARLTGGFEWAAVPSASRGAVAAMSPEVTIAVAQLEQKVRAERTPHALAAHAAGLAILGRLDEAIAALEEATAQDPQRADWWSDLSAAYLARGDRDDRAVDFPLALQAAERALATSPKPISEALFNKALALEKLHIRNQAIAAWRDYVSVESSPAWAEEGRQHLTLLERQAADRRSDLQADRESLLDDLLPRWASAVVDAPHDASGILAEARRLATRITSQTSDRFADDVMRAVERIEEDRRNSGPLLAALRAYGRARAHYRDARYGDAASEFQNVAAALGTSGNPLRYAAELYGAIVDYRRGEFQPARRRLDALATPVEDRQYGALSGRIHWIVGLMAVLQGDHREGFARYQRALKAFRASGESRNAAFVLTLIADEEEWLGDTTRAWSARLEALAGERRPAALIEAAGSARTMQWLHLAAAFQAEATTEARATGRQLELADALRELALTSTALGRAGQADAALSEAHQIVQSRSEPEWDRMRAEIDVAWAHCAPADAPSDGIAAATRALEYFHRIGATSRLPEIHRHRARLTAAIDPDAARRDLLTAFDVLEREARGRSPAARVPLLSGEIRRLSDELVTLELARNDWEAALAAAERGRARDLFPVAWDADHEAALRQVAEDFPANVSLVYHQFTATELLTWVVEDGRVQGGRRPIDSSRVDRLVRAFTADPDNVRTARELRDIVLSSERAVSDRREVVVLVPDGPLHRLAVAALPGYDRRYLVEERAVVVVPSLRWWLRAEPIGSRRAAGAVTVIGNPKIDRTIDPALADLPHAGAEAGSIAALYPGRARLLTHTAATREAVLSALPSSEIVHFAGHAVVNELAPERSRLVVWDDRARPLTAADLAPLECRRTRLVVLAACDAATGMVTRADGPLGLARSLLAAGVEAVVASLWKVDDAAATALFVRFHEEFRTSGDPIRSLQLAQIALATSNDPALQRPAAWGGFVVTGTYRHLE